MNITKYFKKIMRRIRYLPIAIGLVITRIITLAATPGNGSITITPTAPVHSSVLTTFLGYLEWLAIVGGIGVGGILAAFKIMAEHDVEGGKRAFLYSIIGGIIIGVISFIINSVI